MTTPDADLDARAANLTALLVEHPGALVAALGTDGIRVPVPASLGVPDGRQLPMPGRPAAMVGLVVADDTWQVVHSWERALSTGLGRTVVRTRQHTDRATNLTFIDLRAGHDVVVSVLTDAGDSAALPVRGQRGSASAARGSLSVPTQPRTATVTKNLNAWMLSVDERTTRMLGWPAEQLLGRRSLDFIHPDDRARALANWMDMMVTRTGQRVRVRHQRLDGSWLWVELENTYRAAERLEDSSVLTVMTEISAEMAAYEALDQREKLLRRITTAVPRGLLQLAADRSVVYTNPRLSAILGVGESGSLPDYLSGVAEHDRPALDKALALTVDVGLDQQLEIDYRPPDMDERRRCAITLIALTDREGAPGALMCVDDITESARMRAELEFKAGYDPLTGCHNRNSIMAALHNALATQDDHRAGVIFIDLDKFKPVNDTLGHAAGDELLIHTATTLAGAVRGGDLVGRIGGDEFLLVCPAADTAGVLLMIAERLYAAVRGTVTLSAGTVVTGASIGCALATATSTSDQLVAAADEAMYESKRRGDGRPVLAGRS